MAIMISFKKDEVDLEEWIKSHSSYAPFVKDILRQKMEEEKSGFIQEKSDNSASRPKVKKVELVDLTNF